VTAQSTAPPRPPMRVPEQPTDRETLDAALRRMPQFQGMSWDVEPLTGGLTNRIYKVTPSTGPPVVARLSAGKSELLAIDRVAECHNAGAAAQAGAGPRLLACEPAEGVAIVEWIDGRTFQDTDLDDSKNLARVAATCRQLHAGPRFTNDFDMFEIHRGYLDVVTQHGFRLPRSYRNYLPAVGLIRNALAVRQVGTVPCHNDLLAANMMDDGARLWFIDYEYAGNNDPCFELGNIWSEADLGLERLTELVGAYYGDAAPAKVARARLLALMSKYGWTLWASIQDAVSDVAFDFWTWGMEKYERAVAEFEGPQFARLIDDVQQPT
jgi:thiamine kinase-like enzyme